MDAWAERVPAWARMLADAVWPGPLTLIVPKASTVLPAVTGGQGTVGLRVPAHPMTLEVLERFGSGLAAPSANRYGRVSPTTAAHVVAELGEYLDARHDLVLDGGPCPVGVESTIVGAWDDTPRLLRPGAVTVAQITDVTGLSVVADAAGVRAPGTTASHYAPRAQVLAVDPDRLEEALASVPADASVGVLAPAEMVSVLGVVRLASPAGDAEYAHVLYAALREADALGLDVVVAVLPSASGVGLAVRDRLWRAAAEQVGR
jgi:L-threonylcarbamoyladenylate synthase